VQAVLALDDMFEWLRSGGRVGIYDATNSNKGRRQLIMSRCTDEHIQVIFIESICEDPGNSAVQNENRSWAWSYTLIVCTDIIQSTLRETKLHSPE